MQANKTIVEVKYDGVNITTDISKYLIDFIYTDNVTGKADEIDLVLNDSEELFQNQWFPDKKSTITARIIQDGITLECGTFFIDEVTLQLFPDQMTWHCVSVDPNSQLGTKKHKGFSKITLLEIAKDIAGNHGLKVDDGTKTIVEQNPKTDVEQTQLGKIAALFLRYSNEPNNVFFYNQMSALQNELLKIITQLEGKGYIDQANDLRAGVGENLTDKSTLEPTGPSNSSNKIRLGASKMSTLIYKIKGELRVSPATTSRTLGLGLSKIKVERSTQNCETDLEYLKRISSMYGIAFNIKPPYLVFYSAHHLNDTPSSLTIDKSQIFPGGTITDKTHGTYSDVKVVSHNPHTNEVITNSTEIPNTAAEQQKLQVLSQQIAAAAKQTEGIRSSIIQGQGATVTSIFEGLVKKGFSEEYEALRGSYSIMAAAQTAGSCTRFAELCTTIKAKLIQIQVKGKKVAKDKDTYAGGQSSNTLLINTRVENQEQADAVAKAALLNANSETRTGTITIPGNPRACAGINFDLTGAGRMSQKFTIKSSTHSVTGGEYTTSIDFKSGAVVLKVGKRPSTGSGT